tara:strand:+ start:706 stop:1044 length:339 start_codon:yes stop_codon:yes gene_type:complete
MDTEFKDTPEVTDNPELKDVVECRNDLMNFIVQYVGEKANPENNDVTVETIVEVFAEDFPEFLMAVAEENWIRGYHQAMSDVEEGERLLNVEATETTDEETATEEETTGEDG